MEELQRRSTEPGPARERGPVVLVGVDGSRASRCAALAAASAARRMEGSVLAVHVPTLSPLAALACSMGAGALLGEAQREVSRQIEDELASLLELEDVPWRFVVETGPVGPALVRLAASTRAAVVVVGAPRRTWRGRLAHLLVPSVPRLLLRSGTDRLLIA
ncbi:nucleotide-binding universal stress UspA family protein [Motilibacter rhizosphaerae]|uniref:Nucleotide-binding universal stress UspA family protein n=1 Tax=Motilibacter rhizosphaerae TaxID=598652 RepID=A0A4Q7NV13_9ACTN|nr:universal stress protein [Motilibacter rhizosphaerae]RZS91076.1 nucleotide-binding universal stress UspA family protein [Motilibacter rhizosphaerae]